LGVGALPFLQQPQRIDQITYLTDRGRLTALANRLSAQVNEQRRRGDYCRS